MLIMPSRELDDVFQLIKERSAAPRNTVEESRSAMERNMGQLSVEDDISTERVGAGGIPAEWVVAPEAQDGRVMLYLHGGGYIFGSTRTHRAMVAGISRAAKAKVLSLDYRLAPECPFPAAPSQLPHLECPFPTAPSRKGQLGGGNCEEKKQSKSPCCGDGALFLGDGALLKLGWGTFCPLPPLNLGIVAKVI